MHRTSRFTLSLLSVTAFLSIGPAARADVTYGFQTLNNNADPTFNQLLGINNAGTIVGYFGAGTQANPNKGYSLAPPYTQASYTNENFPGSIQTQVVGINNTSSPATVGFWVDANGNNFGFANQGGLFTAVQNPNTPATGTTVNQLLGVNSNSLAAGFYFNGDGNAQAYLYNIATKQFTALTLPSAFNAMMTTATGVNDNDIVCGFYVDTAGNTHAFIDNGGTFTSLDDPNGGGTNTTFLGLNNNNQVAGSFVDGQGVTNGLVYNVLTNTWQTINDPNSSANPAFDVTGTTVNGINDHGQLVGFYSDGTNVDGFLATPVPEPASLGLLSLGVIAAGLARRRRKNGDSRAS